MKKSKIDVSDVIQFFEIDLDNSLMDGEDWCEIITEFINHPISMSKLYKNELKLYQEERKNEQN